METKKEVQKLSNQTAKMLDRLVSIPVPDGVAAQRLFRAKHRLEEAFHEFNEVLLALKED